MRRVILLIICLFCGSSFANSTKDRTPHESVILDNLPITESSSPRSSLKTLAKIVDKAGNAFFLYESTYLYEGIYSQSLYLANNPESPEKDTIYESLSDPEMGGCYQDSKSELLSEHKIPLDKLKSAYLGESVSKANADGDNYEDLILIIREEECGTKKLIYKGFIISPKDNGYKTNHISAASK